MKQSIYTRILREETVRTNRFEYKVVGKTIMKRRKDATEWEVAKVVK